MSMAAIAWVKDSAPRHGGDARAVLLALAWHADDRGENAFPSQATWARKAGMGERRLRRVIVALEAEGTIERDGYQPGGGTVRWRIVPLADPAHGPRTADGEFDSADTAPACRTGARGLPLAGPAPGRRLIRQPRAEPVRHPAADEQSLNGPERSSLSNASEPRARESEVEFDLRNLIDFKMPA